MNDSTLALATTSVDAFLSTDARNCKPEEFGRLYQKAAMGQRLIRDAAVNARIEIDQKIRVISMVTTDPKIREQWMRQIVPKMLPPAS